MVDAIPATLPASKELKTVFDDIAELDFAAGAGTGTVAPSEEAMMVLRSRVFVKVGSLGRIPNKVVLPLVQYSVVCQTESPDRRTFKSY